MVTTLTVTSALVGMAAATQAGWSPMQLLVGLAATAAAIGVLWKYIWPAVRSLKQLALLSTKTENFLADWNGAPERDGVAEVPSFPKRMKKIEDRTENLHHNLSVELINRIQLLSGEVDALRKDAAGIQAATTDNAHALARVEDRANGIDLRISDHRRRNEETAEGLRKALEQRAAELDEKLRAQAAEIETALQARNQSVDEQLRDLHDGLVKTEAMRSIIHELGFEHRVDRLDP